MNALTILDVVLGLAFVYFVFSVICSTMIEWISAMLGRRPHLLRKGVQALLGQALADQFEAHPLIAGLRRQSTYPSYISGSTFARVLTHLTLSVTPQPGGLATITVKAGLDTRVGTLIESLIQGSSSISEVEQAIEKWFERAIERTSGVYKRWTQLWTIVLASLIVWGCQLDAIQVARDLNTNGALRAAMVQRAVATVKDGNLDEVKKQVGSLGLPNVMSDKPYTPEGTIGLVLSVLAISLGAPFWFDFLNLFLNLRQTGAKPSGSRSTIVGH